MGCRAYILAVVQVVADGDDVILGRPLAACSAGANDVGGKVPRLPIQQGNEAILVISHGVSVELNLFPPPCSILTGLHHHPAPALGTEPAGGGGGSTPPPSAPGGLLALQSGGISSSFCVWLSASGHLSAFS